MHRTGIGKCRGGSGELNRRICIGLALWFGAIAAVPCLADESGRIERPSARAEADRIAIEQAMNDSLLQKGDIVVTNRGYLVFLGMAADGVTNVFAPVPHPGNAVKLR